jgi:hypothetical protein
MSDPFETLKQNLDDGAAGPALPASEVRRRGDRMRRRRTTVRALGAACAVAVIASGGIAMGGNLTGSSPQPPPATRQVDPTPDRTEPAEPRRVVTAIPDDFPLAEGYPADTGSDQELVGPGADVPSLEEGVLVCDQVAYPTVDPAERLGAVFRQPEDFRSRELTTYPDDATARQALTNLVEAHRACARESFGGTPESVTLTEVRQSQLGDDGYAVVRSYELGGEPAIGLSQIQAVRVGNALLLSTTSNEGSGEPEAVDAAVRGEEATIAPLVEAMCVFSEAGCGDDQPTEAAGAVQAAVLSLDDIRGLTTQLSTDWAAVPDRENPTLDCQADWLTTLGAEQTGYREFAGTGSTGKVVTEAASAVLEFADQEQARAAYDTVAGWISACDDRLDGVRPVSASHDPVTMRTGYGPATWRVVESPAPELCSECHTGWIDSQGVALVGNRLALLSIAYTGDQMSGADTGSSPLATGIGTAASRAAGGAEPEDPDATIGPLGIGELQLGMFTWEAPAASLVKTLPSQGGCEIFAIKALPKPDPGSTHGYATENQGVMTLFAQEGMTTPEGIGLGSTLDEIRAAYPRAEKTVHGWSVPVAGFTDRSYLFGIDEDDELEELALTLDTQSCFG